MTQLTINQSITAQIQSKYIPNKMQSRPTMANDFNVSLGPFRLFLVRKSQIAIFRSWTLSFKLSLSALNLVIFLVSLHLSSSTSNITLFHCSFIMFESPMSLSYMKNPQSFTSHNGQPKIFSRGSGHTSSCVSRLPCCGCILLWRLRRNEFELQTRIHMNLRVWP